MDKILIYTDGASRGNPGKGGFGVILIWGEKRKEISSAYRHTTNNRMELLGVITALQSIKKKDLPIHIFSDSKYVIDSVEKKWLVNWIKTDFKGGKKNKDLWMLYHQVASPFKIKFHWVKGHSTNTFNNRCDELATLAADNGPWEIDSEFESIK